MFVKCPICGVIAEINLRPGPRPGDRPDCSEFSYSNEAALKQGCALSRSSEVEAWFCTTLNLASRHTLRIAVPV